MKKLGNDVIDKGGRRQGIDRRQVTLEPDEDKRSEKQDRRFDQDRRDKWSYKKDDAEEQRNEFNIK
jgi:hypothetical protein